jgi:hypothetical protein
MEDKQGVTCLACMRVLGSIPTKWGGGMKLINEMSFIKKKKKSQKSFKWEAPHNRPKNDSMILQKK